MIPKYQIENWHSFPNLPKLQKQLSYEIQNPLFEQTNESVWLYWKQLVNSQFEPEYPIIQEQLLKDLQIPFPPQVKVELNWPKQIGCSQFKPEYPRLQLQKSGDLQIPLEEHTYFSVEHFS